MEISMTMDPTTAPVIMPVVVKVSGSENRGMIGHLEWFLIMAVVQVNGAMIVCKSSTQNK